MFGIGRCSFFSSQVIQLLLDAFKVFDLVTDMLMSDQPSAAAHKEEILVSRH